jgi:D-alanyl-D-alanine carboxypeptidase
MIRGFTFAFEPSFGLHSPSSGLREPIVNIPRPPLSAGRRLSRLPGSDQQNGPRRVRHSQSLWALAIGIALSSLCTATLTATPARAEELLLVEADSGKVLRAENATYPWYPASVTKLMTAYVTLRAVKEHRITLDTLFTVSRNAAAQSPTKMGFPPGTQVTVDNALKMLMVHSANDMAVLLAEGVDGSIENFADDMTRTAHGLGMTESNFVNPNGLPADGQITSARDLAILARALMREFPEYDSYWHIAAIKFGRRIIRNTNSMLGRYPGIDGMKTGYICASGFNIVATATRGGKRLIAVVLGAPSSGARAVKAAELLESGFTQNPLGWLTPSLGTVDALTPIDAAPPNLHEEMCGPHRKKPAAEEEEEAANGSENSGGEGGAKSSTLLSSLRAPTPKGAALLSDQGAVTPVVVYTGPTKTPAQIAALDAVEPAPPPHHKKKGAAKAADAKAADEKPTDSHSTRGRDADGKGANEKTKGKAAAWTPTSSSSLATSPPPGLETRSGSEPPKKKHKAAKADATAKPAPAQ